ncbi:nucleotidyltransferase domain-containing protein [soil metagenome]
MASQGLVFGLSPTIIADLQAGFAQYPEINQVLIFGSRAKNTWKEGSDIDIALLAPSLSKQRFAELWNKIDDLPIVFKIDCLLWDSLTNQQLKNKILQEGYALF